MILTCRKLETGPLENYTHMATLIHKANLLMLEYDSLYDLRNIIQLVFNDKLLVTILDFCMNTECFCGFGIRMIELFSLEFSERIAKTEIFEVIQGLLRTNDYETIAQCLSFVNVIAQQIHTKEQEYLNNIKSNLIKNKEELKEPVKLVTVVKPRLLALIMQSVSKNPKDSQIEFVHYLLELITIIMTNGDLRAVLLETELNGLKDIADSV